MTSITHRRHYPPVPYTPAPYPGYSAHPVPYGYPSPDDGLDMRTGLKAIGAILPGIGQILGAFRRAPDRPQMTGQPEKDLPRQLT